MCATAGSYPLDRHTGIHSAEFPHGLWEFRDNVRDGPMLLGYARVSTDDQDLAFQRRALREAGCRRRSKSETATATVPSPNPSCRSGSDRPSVLFERAAAWLIAHKVLLPGVTTLERSIANVRARAAQRLWRQMLAGSTADQTERLEALLVTPHGRRQTRRQELGRRAGVRVASKATTSTISAAASADPSAGGEGRSRMRSSWPAAR